MTRVTILLVPYSWRKPIKLNRDFEERELLFIALVSNCLHRSCQDISWKKFQIKTITSSKISQQLRLMVQYTRGKQFFFFYFVFFSLFFFLFKETHINYLHCSYSTYNTTLSTYSTYNTTLNTYSTYNTTLNTYSTYNTTLNTYSNYNTIQYSTKQYITILTLFILD